MLTVMRAPTFSCLPAKAGVTLKLPAVKHMLPACRAHFLPVGRRVVWLTNGHPCPWHLTTTVAPRDTPVTTRSRTMVYRGV